MGGAEVGSSEGQDFEGEAFGFDHYEAGEGEADHGRPVVEGWVMLGGVLYLGESQGRFYLKGCSPLFVMPGQQ